MQGQPLETVGKRSPGNDFYAQETSHVRGDVNEQATVFDAGVSTLASEILKICNCSRFVTLEILIVGLKS